MQKSVSTEPNTDSIIENLRKKALDLPTLPGVYIMKDKQSRVIYVGKAVKLKNRVSGYFNGFHDPKTEAMTSKIADFDVIISASEFEALVLENSLIKHHSPRYNIKLKDDKGYPYIRINLKTTYPIFKVVAKPENDNATYLGPYSGRKIIRDAIDAVSKALKLPTCGKDIAKIAGKERPCLNYHIGICRAYCANADLYDIYVKSVKTAIEVFSGKTDKIIENLFEQMNEDAESLQFEAAAEKRDRIRALQSLEQKQFAVAGSMADTDVIGFFRSPVKTCFAVMHYIDGKLISKDYELFDTPFEDDSEAMSGLLCQYYEIRGVIPKNILLPFHISDITLLQQLFEQKTGKKVYIQTPVRGDKAKLTENAVVNAREEAERASTREEKTRKTLEWLRHSLRLETEPLRIESYDISNTANTDIVAAMVVYEKGIPYKKDYRKFKIKTLTGQDDYAAIKEVILRRISRYKNEDNNFSKLPDLILVDGGAAHASAAYKALNETGVNIPVFGMVKDDKHKTRGLISQEGEEIGISANPPVFVLISSIQEETHRYAVEYHRELRSKNSYKSSLDNIKGVGEKRRNDLLKSFGSIKAIKEAPVEELAKVVPKNTATEIKEYYRSKK